MEAKTLYLNYPRVGKYKREETLVLSQPEK